MPGKPLDGVSEEQLNEVPEALRHWPPEYLTYYLTLSKKEREEFAAARNARVSGQNLCNLGSFPDLGSKDPQTLILMML